jgi:hypothetical protein
LVLSFLLIILVSALGSPAKETVIYREISLMKIKGLQDCQMLAIETDGTKLYVIRCPNSDVSLHWTQGNKNIFVHTTEKI